MVLTNCCVARDNASLGHFLKHLRKTPIRIHQPTSGTKMATFKRDRIQNVCCQKSIFEQDRLSNKLFSCLDRNCSNSYHFHVAGVLVIRFYRIMADDSDFYSL